MNGKFLLDTNIIIDYLKERKDCLFNSTILTNTDILISTSVLNVDKIRRGD
jgi:predicted nucleic acid-binding protein